MLLGTQLPMGMGPTWMQEVGLFSLIAFTSFDALLREILHVTCTEKKKLRRFLSARRATGRKLTFHSFPVLPTCTHLTPKND